MENFTHTQNSIEFQLEASCENRSKVHQNRNDGPYQWKYLFEEISSKELFCDKVAAQLPSNDPKKNGGLQDLTKRPLETECLEENKHVFEGKVLFKNDISESLFPGPKRDQFLFLGTPCSSKTCLFSSEHSVSKGLFVKSCRPQFFFGSLLGS
ncbi:hypothetical protein ACFFRR_011729 [Megaselia abdita]